MRAHFHNDHSSKSLKIVFYRLWRAVRKQLPKGSISASPPFFTPCTPPAKGNGGRRTAASGPTGSLYLLETPFQPLLYMSRLMAPEHRDYAYQNSAVVHFFTGVLGRLGGRRFSQPVRSPLRAIPHAEPPPRGREALPTCRERLSGLFFVRT